jgi:hypothetical protein
MLFSRDNLGYEARQIRTVVPLIQSQYSARLALDHRTKQDAFRLRYDSYMASDYIEPNAARLFRDQYDDLPNCQTIVIYDNGVPAASVRTCTLALGSELRSPASDTFAQEVNELLSQQPVTGYGGGGIETTRLVRSPAAENNH